MICTNTDQYVNALSTIKKEKKKTRKKKRAKHLLSTDWLYITLLNFVKLNTLLLMENSSHKLYTTLKTLAVVWALCSFRIFFWSELCWRALKERNSWCEQIDFILRSLTLLSWPLCSSRRVRTSDMHGSQLWEWFEHSGTSRCSFELTCADEPSKSKTAAVYRLIVYYGS